MMFCTKSCRFAASLYPDAGRMFATLTGCWHVSQICSRACAQVCPSSTRVWRRIAGPERSSRWIGFRARF